MREFVYALVSEDATVAAAAGHDPAELPDAVFGSNSVDTPPMRPFIILHWDTTTERMGTSFRRDLTVWVHDEPADYARIDEVLQRIRDLFAGVVAAESAVGWITLIDWQGESGDLQDDGYQTITRNASYRVVGSGI